MQSTNGGKRYTSMKEIASTARRREGIRATLKAAIEAWTGPGILILLFLASFVCVVFGGTFEVPSAFEPETSIAAVAVEPADVGGTLRTH